MSTFNSEKALEAAQRYAEVVIEPWEVEHTRKFLNALAEDPALSHLWDAPCTQQAFSDAKLLVMMHLHSSSLLREAIASIPDAGDDDRDFEIEEAKAVVAQEIELHREQPYQLLIWLNSKLSKSHPAHEAVLEARRDGTLTVGMLMELSPGLLLTVDASIDS